MTPVTTEDRRKELAVLLRQMEAQPSHDWTQARERVRVLQQMISADERNMQDQQASA